MKPVGQARTMWLALVTAATWAAALVVGAFVVPVYASVTYLSSGTPTRTIPRGPVRLTQTLVEVNGLSGAVEMAVPLLVTLVVAAALRRGVHGAPMVVAWAATGLLVFFNLLSMLTIGLFMLPVTAALLVACVKATRVAPAAGT